MTRYGKWIAAVVIATAAVWAVIGWIWFAYSPHDAQRDTARWAGEGIDRLEAWLTVHDVSVDLVTVWSIAVGATILALVEYITGFVLRGSGDRSDVGRSLKAKKWSSGDAWTAIAVLYAATLVAYYLDAQFNLWERLAVRVFLIVGIWLAVVFGIRFLVAYRREGWGR